MTFRATMSRAGDPEEIMSSRGRFSSVVVALLVSMGLGAEGTHAQPPGRPAAPRSRDIMAGTFVATPLVRSREVPPLEFVGTAHLRSREIPNLEFVGMPLVRSREMTVLDFVGTPLIRSREITGLDFVGTPGALRRRP